MILGTIILDENFQVSELEDMLLTMAKDTSCTGSNLYVYFCMIFVPNMLIII